MPFILDDSDLSIRYSDGDWTKGGVEGEFNSTIHGTRAANAYAVIPFSGKYIEVYGTIAAKAAGSPNPIGTYSIDSGEPVQFSPAIKDTVQHQHLFFTASGLSAGDHTLVIESTVQGSYLGLDFVSYTPSTVLVTTSTSLIWAAPTSNSSPSSSSTNAVTSDFSLPTGIVVGSIFAAIAVTFLCCAALFYCYWRRRREQMKEPKPFPAFIEDLHQPKSLRQQLAPFCQ
ncbi:hypothetical protein C8J56DRAFT_476721 [Mycena floridula]|nr:hypothetical protein C8J56DRAFT_476721 [Mycena floridula]